MLISHIENKSVEIPLITNKVIPNNLPTKWQIDTPWLGHSCQKSTPCKGIIAQHLKDAGFKIIAIGNSETDICMTDLADLTFATGSLVNILNDKKHNFVKFEDFNDISNILFSIKDDTNEN